MIFGREKETEEINEYLSTDGSKVLLVYGRKGIGKSALLKEILKNRPHAYLTAYETTGSEELSVLSKEMNLNLTENLALISILTCCRPRTRLSSTALPQTILWR